MVAESSYLERTVDCANARQQAVLPTALVGLNRRRGSSVGKIWAAEKIPKALVTGALASRSHWSFYLNFARQR